MAAVGARGSLPAAVDAVKALAHPGRLRLLAMLRAGDLCVCQMMAVLGQAASTVSSHLGDLRRAGLVRERRRGKWVHYHLVDEGPLADVVERALRLVDDDEQVRKDAGAARAVRKQPLETFCRVGGERAAARPRTRPGGEGRRARQG